MNTNPTTNTLGQRLHYYCLLALITALSHMGFRLLYILSDLLFPVLYHLVRYRRRIVRRNLTECFPEKPTDELRRIERKFYHFFLDNAFESCKLKSLSADELKRHVTVAGVEAVNADLAAGESVSALIGHYGNWEWISSMSLWLHKAAVPAQIYRTLNDKAMDTLMICIRQRMGQKCVEMRQTVRYMAEGARSGRPQIIGFIADQSPKHREAKHFIPFLNHDTPVLTGTEKATKHFGYKAYFISVRRPKRGYYQYTFTSLHDNPKSLPDFELTSLYFRALEQEIRQAPEYYLWSHNRFKYASRQSAQADKPEQSDKPDKPA